VPPLSNPRHERFVQALFEGETADAAYAKAGYKPNDGNCIRLKGNERVKARLIELQTQAAKASEVTVESLLAELEQARSRADSLDQLSAAVRAIEAKAKVSGLLVQKVEVRDTDALSGLDSVDAVVNACLHEYTGNGYQFTEAQRVEFAGLMTGWAEAINQFLASITARPVRVIVGNSPADLRAQELRRRRNRPAIGFTATGS
jgi:hypothetical protein